MKQLGFTLLRMIQALFCILIIATPLSTNAQPVALTLPNTTGGTAKSIAESPQSVLSIKASPGSGGTTNYSVPVQTLLLFSALSFLPAVLLLMTSFTRIIIVLSLLRQALGLQTTPPNQVLIGIAL